MSINNITNQPYIPKTTVDLKTDQQPVNTKKENIQNKKDVAAEYVPAEKKQKATYAKPDTATIERLKEESNQSHRQLRDMVAQLLERQGLTFKDLDTFGGDIPIDNQTRIEAQAAIDEGGPYSPENTSDRIVDFAKAISGGDKSKLKVLRGAIEKGFEEAAKAFGGKLPEISKETHTLIMDKLDAWEQEA